MLITEVWTPILFLGTHWLIQKYKKLELRDEDDGDSDDSELDELGVRTPLNSPMKRRASSRQEGQQKNWKKEKDQKKYKNKLVGLFGKKAKRKLRWMDGAGDGASAEEDDDNESKDSYGRDSDSAGSEVSEDSEDSGGGHTEDVEDGMRSPMHRARDCLVWSGEGDLPQRSARSAGDIEVAIDDARFVTGLRDSPVPTPAVKRSGQSDAYSGSAIISDKSDQKKKGLVELAEQQRMLHLTSSLSPQSGSGSDSARRSIVVQSDQHFAYTEYPELEYLAQWEEEQFITLDMTATVSPEEFSSMWEILSLAGEFSCLVSPIARSSTLAGSTTSPESERAFRLADLQKHMRSMGFFVVAVADGTADSMGSSKLYAYASAFPPNSSRSSSEAPVPIHFLIELQISTPNQHSLNGDQEPGSSTGILTRTLRCKNKCTRREFTALFVQELNLGCVFDLF